MRRQGGMEAAKWRTTAHNDGVKTYAGLTRTKRAPSQTWALFLPDDRLFLAATYIPRP